MFRFAGEALWSLVDENTFAAGLRVEDFEE
jgi:hypothetical protein